MSKSKSHILMLSKYSSPMKFVSLVRGMSLVFKERAEIVECELGTFQRFSIDEWLDHSKEMWKDESNRALFDWHPGMGQRIIMPTTIQCVDEQSEKFRKRRPRLTRKNLFMRDHGECVYCHKPLTTSTFTIDHVIPQAQGGKDQWKNVVVCCSRCNGFKANRTPQQAGMSLSKIPSHPQSEIELEASMFSREDLRAGWEALLKPYLDMESGFYWESSIGKD